MRKTVGMTVILAFASVGCNQNKYEVIERTQREVPNPAYYQTPGTHTEVRYVLLHDGHKIHATCDLTTVDKLDPHSSCGFRPLRTYECDLGGKEDKALSDLKCQDSDGYNVYLYVDKKE